MKYRNMLRCDLIEDCETNEVGKPCIAVRHPFHEVFDAGEIGAAVDPDEEMSVNYETGLFFRHS